MTSPLPPNRPPATVAAPIDGSAARHRGRGFHGRRKGKALSPAQRARLAERLPQLALDLSVPPPPALANLFSSAVEAVRLEIGFGGAEHLLAEAERNPAQGLIGVEPFVNGLAKAVRGVEALDLGNVRLFGEDAALLLDWLPPAGLIRVDLLYPDPWPKTRHHKRRFVSPANIDRLARVLAPGGEWRFATDIDGYAEWTLALVRRAPAFLWTAERADDWRRPWPGWPGTRYEAKAMREGRRPTYLTFRRA